MQKIVFDSEQLPGDDRLRKEAWIDTLASAVVRLHANPAPSVPFEGRLEIVPLHDGSVSVFTATVRNTPRVAADIAADGCSAAILMVNVCQKVLHMSQNGRDADFAPGEAILLDVAEPSDIAAMTSNMSCLIGVQLPRSLLRQKLADFEDRFLVPVPAQSGALALARAYIDALFSHQGPGDPVLNRLALSHLADLVAAAVRPYDETATEQSSGQRAARLIMIEREIDRSFDDPDFSLTMLAQRLGVTTRYIQMLLAANETSFVDEVIDRRLHRARDILASPLHSHMSIIDIAHECGFSTVSHFHRAFKRWFGATPGEVREQAS